MTPAIKIQRYPRLQNNLLDETTLKPHVRKLSIGELEKIVLDAIQYANIKSSRDAFNIPDDASDDEINEVYTQAGRRLFQYFIEHCVDPASTTYQCFNQSYKEVGAEQFRNWITQKARMNTGWRYQSIAKNAASVSGRFETISDIGTQEADFNAVISYCEGNGVLTIYVSVKNRESTMGGQDWPKAIAALEKVAINDKNRVGDYICVFGIAIDKGLRHIKSIKKTGQPHSINTEIWRSGFFWPFFTNLTYEEIIQAVLNQLMATETADPIAFDIPVQILNSFGECCKKHNLVSDNGDFNNIGNLIKLFCGS
ncbi:MAG: hypothetical protein NTY09_06115 [bacterium]|nr:hypothetical protein [bacterium]